MSISAVLLKSNAANILSFNFREQKFVHYDPILIAIEFFLIFKKILQLWLRTKIPTHQNQNELNLKRSIFVGKISISIFCKWIAGPLKGLKRIGWTVGFNSQISWTLYVIIQRSLTKTRLKDVSEWTFTHTLCHSTNILGCMLCFWLFMLWFIEKCLPLFYQIMNILSYWRCFSFPKSLYNFCTQRTILP